MSVQSAIQKQNLRRSQVADTVADFSMVTGVVKLSGAGEGYADISFPVTFIEKPTVSFGYELEQGYQGRYIPTCNAVVNNWIVADLKSSSFRCNGCSLGFFVFAESDTVSYLHFTFTGVAFRNPVNPSMDPKEKI